MSKLNIPFVQRDKHLCPRTDGYSTALSARYDGWGGAIRQPRTTHNGACGVWLKQTLPFLSKWVTLFALKGHPLRPQRSPTSKGHTADPINPADNINPK